MHWNQDTVDGSALLGYDSYDQGKHHMTNLAVFPTIVMVGCDLWDTLCMNSLEFCEDFAEKGRVGGKRGERVG